MWIPMTCSLLRLTVRAIAWAAGVSLALTARVAASDEPIGRLSTADYPSIQAALDANPGKMLFVPPGDHALTNAIRIRHADSGLYGFGRLVQHDTNSAVIEVRGASHVRVRDLTLTRASGREDSRQPAIAVMECDSVSLCDLRIMENRAAAGAISLRKCARAQVRDCRIENYSTIAVDDRTASQLYGYAFNCIDGSGISASACPDLLVRGNRVVETHLRPTPEVKERFKLGQFVKRNATKGTLIHPKTWEAGYVNNWHQGSAIVVTGPEESVGVRLLDNHIENAAQGIDLHADNVIVSGNIVINAFIGMKAMHGSRHVLIANNQFIRNDLWAIGLMPGAAAHPAEPARDGKPARPPNVDAGHIVANNIITDFGYGDAHWIWHVPQDNCVPLRFDNGQERDDPPLRDVLVTGNLVYDTGRDDGQTNGVPQTSPPHYRWTVFVSKERGGPTGLKFSNNLFHPGTEGVSNVPLE